MSNRTPPTDSKSTMPQSGTLQVPQEKVAMRAYEMWCKRGCSHGNHEADWLQAEAEIRAEMTRPGASMAASIPVTPRAPQATPQAVPQRTAQRR